MAPGRSPGKALLLLAAAVGLGCVALLVLFGRPEAPRPPEPAALAQAGAGARDEREQAPAPAAAPPRADAPAAAEPAAQPTPVSRPEPEAPGKGAASDDAGLVPSGIGLFPPPGTDPIKIGLVVPDDFELPEGFLRHYQVTDDGQELPPILLFHPDYEVLGDDGRPIALPENRVVPPELAPPGMPQQRLVPPPPREEEEGR